MNSDTVSIVETAGFPPALEILENIGKMRQLFPVRELCKNIKKSGKSQGILNESGKSQGKLWFIN